MGPYDGATKDPVECSLEIRTSAVQVSPVYLARWVPMTVQLKIEWSAAWKYVQDCAAVRMGILGGLHGCLIDELDLQY